MIVVSKFFPLRSTDGTHSMDSGWNQFQKRILKDNFTSVLLCRRQEFHFNAHIALFFEFLRRLSRWLVVIRMNQDGLIKRIKQY